jgi:hypothetical protein
MAAYPLLAFVVRPVAGIVSVTRSTRIDPSFLDAVRR